MSYPSPVFSDDLDVSNYIDALKSTSTYGNDLVIDLLPDNFHLSKLKILELARDEVIVLTDCNYDFMNTAEPKYLDIIQYDSGDEECLFS